MDNYDYIMSLSKDELANLIYHILNEHDKELQRLIQMRSGLEVHLVGLAPDIVISRHRAWLDEECEFRQEEIDDDGLAE